MAKQSLANYDAKQYWTSRDFHTSARLHLQHWMMNCILGYVLHPSIPTDTPNLRVADVAAGNGYILHTITFTPKAQSAWTIDLARLLPSSAELSGFDITASNYPAPEWLPSNVGLHVLDAFAPDLPDHLVGAFDIVHIRAIVSAVRDNAVEPLLKNLVKMLKPGGYLQWDEGNPDTTAARSPRPEVSNKACAELLELLNRFGKLSKMRTEWLDDLPKTLEGQGMKVTEQKKFEPPKELSKVWTDDLLMVYEEIQWSLPAAANAGPNPALTREMYQDLFARVLKETQEGVSLSMDNLVIVSQKMS